MESCLSNGRCIAVGLEVKYPYLLLLFIPAILLIYLYIKSTKRLSLKEKYLIVGLRSLVFICLILAISVPQILLSTKGSVIFVVDRSASLTGTEEKMLDWIEKSVKDKDKEQPFAVVSFGKEAMLEQQLDTRNKVNTQLNSEIGKNETNLEGAIGFASTLIPENESGRIVLLTDGNETIGKSKEAAALLKNRHIEMDYVPIKRPDHEDMALSELSVPPSLYQGEKAKINVTITSNREKNANIRISVNDKEIISEKVLVKQGNNVYSFLHDVAEPGMLVYKGEIITDGDAFLENNTLNTVTNVKGTPKVLIVQRNGADSLGPILQKSGLIVEQASPEKLPTELSGYLQYQSIIFNNVSGTSVTEKQMNLIEKAVKEFGVGFVMAGGNESFGLGGYFKTPIEKLLPVDMEIKGKNELPSLGLIIVLDRSGSMQGYKLDMAKEAAARSVELLREKDTLGFIAFDDRPWTIVETKPLKDKKKVADQIRSITPGGGTEIYSSLEMAYKELEDLKVQRKHIILLTDGQSNTNSDYDRLIEKGKEENITLSTVAIGTDAARGLLEDLATSGSGRFYDVTDASVIPSILSRETVMATRTYIEDEPFYPKIQADPEWASLFQKGVPQMNAYIATTAKSRAKVSFLSEKDDPVLAEWRYGLGTTIAYTSDFSGKWSGDFARWANWPQFVNQLVTRTLPQFDSEPFRVSLEKQGENTVVHLQSTKGDLLPLEASIVGQSGKSIDVNTKLVAPGKYDLVIPNEAGMYFLRVKQAKEGGALNVYQTGFTVPYSTEYSLNGTNKQLLSELASVAGGKELKKEQDAFRPFSAKSYKKQSISQWLLLAAFLFLVVEIVIRRFGLRMFMNYFSRFKRTSPATTSDGSQTIERLATVAKAEKSGKKVFVQEKKNSSQTGSSTTTDRTTNQHNEKSKPKLATQVQPKPTSSPHEQGNSKETSEERMKRLLEARKRGNR